MSALTDYFTSLANKIRSKTGGSNTMTPTEMVSEIDDVYLAGRNSVTSQSKSATPTTVAQTITPDSGYDYLSQVSVGAIQTQTKSCTPTTSAQTITPDTGKFLSSVSVSAIQTQTKTANAYQSYGSVLSVTPDSGKYLSKVNIPKAFDGNLTISVGSTGSMSAQAIFNSPGYYLLFYVSSSEDVVISAKSNVELISSPNIVTNIGTNAYSHIILVKSISATGSYVTISTAGAVGKRIAFVKIADL